MNTLNKNFMSNMMSDAMNHLLGRSYKEKPRVESEKDLSASLLILYTLRPFSLSSLQTLPRCKIKLSIVLLSRLISSTMKF